MGTIRNRVRRSIIAIDEAVSCREAAGVLAERRIASIGVLREGRLVGIVSGRELVATFVRGGPGATPVAAALRGAAPAVSVDASDRECAQLMRSHRTAHLAVQEGGEIIGMISLLDLSGLLGEDGARRATFDPMGLVPVGIRPFGDREHGRGWRGAAAA